jgi:hypothetical protein
MQLRIPEAVRIGDYTFAAGVANVENPAHIDRLIALGASDVEEQDDAAEEKKKKQLENLAKARAARKPLATHAVPVPAVAPVAKAEKP